ncbi:MAG: hypothetical protein KDD47_09060, partial [Acidobacteria bacterium]|nr:hypothetical protein [Acidobacteriota bacterium]
MMNQATSTSPSGHLSNRRGLTRHLSGLLAAGLLLAAAPLLSAGLPKKLQEQDALRGLTVWDSLVLTPDPYNEVDLGEVRLEHLSDGSRRVLIRGALTPGERKDFAYVVDPQAGTFTTFKLPPSYLDGILERSREEGDSESTREAPMSGGPLAPS